MGQERIASACSVCGKAYKTRHAARKHVGRNHAYNIKIGVAQHVSDIWIDLNRQAAILPSMAGKEESCKR